MKPWEDQTLLEMIVFAQQNPDCDLGPLRDRIQEMNYSNSDLHTDKIFDSLLAVGYKVKQGMLQWYEIKVKMGLPINYHALIDRNLAIPFPDPH